MAGRRITLLWLLSAAVVVSTGCGGPPPTPFKPVADVKQLMQAVVDPSADSRRRVGIGLDHQFYFFSCSSCRFAIWLFGSSSTAFSRLLTAFCVSFFFA